LYRKLYHLKAEGRDDVWIRVIEDYLAPVFCRNIDIIVGNPPWINWERLPAFWKLRARDMLEAFGLWQTTVAVRNTRRTSSSTPRSDIASMVFVRCIATYLSRSGVCALLTPQSLLIGESGQIPFRRCHALTNPGYIGGSERIDQPYRIISIDDFTSINPFAPDAANRTVLIIGERIDTPVSEVNVEGLRWTRRVAGARLDRNSGWLTASKILSPESVTYKPITKSIQSPWAYGIPSDILLHEDTDL
jgi:hypothetical protein